MSQNPHRRLRALQPASPYVLTLEFCAVFKGNLAWKIEEKIHETLDAHRMCGEWFNVSTLEAINTLKIVAMDFGCRVNTYNGIEKELSIDDEYIAKFKNCQPILPRRVSQNATTRLISKWRNKEELWYKLPEEERRELLAMMAIRRESELFSVSLAFRAARMAPLPQATEAKRSSIS